jgi:putative transposase
MSEKKALPQIPSEVLDQLMAGGDMKDVFASGGLFDALKKAMAERILSAEMDHHLDSEASQDQVNRRNGVGRKTILTDTGSMEIEVPRDREGRFDPQLIGKYQRRFPGFDEKIISMYARGMSTRDIQGHLLDIYGLEVSPDLISTVTGGVLEEVSQWQMRPLEATYPIVFFDAIRVKIRDEGSVKNQPIHIALGVRYDGRKEVLGLWVEQNEGAKFWLRVMNELRLRGLNDILIAVVDDPKASRTRLRLCSPRPWCRPASSTCCATASICYRGRIVNPSLRPSRASTAQPMRTKPKRRSRPLRRTNGAKNTPPLAKSGAGSGPRSSRSSPLGPMCAK